MLVTSLDQTSRGIRNAFFMTFYRNLPQREFEFYSLSQSHTPLKYQENQTLRTFVLHLTVSAHTVLCKLFMSLCHAKSSIRHTKLILSLFLPCSPGKDVTGKRVSMREKRWFPTLPSHSQSEPHFCHFLTFLQITFFLFSSTEATNFRVSLIL